MSENPSKIRRAAPEDHAALARIWKEAVRATHGFLAEEDFLYYKAHIPEYLATIDLYVCEEEGKIKGFAGILHGKIEMLFVGERGKGIGRQLLDFATEKLRATEVDVNTQNEAALGFYLKYGFTETSRTETDAQGRPYPIVHLALTGK